MGSQRVFVIGDIHGCLGMLKRLMDKIDWRPEKDGLIFVGDYIDRGEDSKGVVDYILSLFKVSSNIQCLKGNHDALFMDYLDNKDRGLFLLGGGRKTLKSYRVDSSEGGDIFVPPDHMDFFQSLRSFVELEDYYVVHAGFRPGFKISEQRLEDMLWIRDGFIESSHDFGKKVIFGHTPFYQPLVTPNKIGLDTGAVYGNRLTCLELTEFRFHSVEA